MLEQFIILNIVNVILQTAKSLIMIKGTKLQASTMNAIAFGVYQVILVMASCELPLWQKIAIVARCNFIGVYVTKTVEEKLTKDRLWKIEFTVLNELTSSVREELKNVSHRYFEIGRYTSFECFCASREESRNVQKIIDKYNAKYFVTENKVVF